MDPPFTARCDKIISARRTVLGITSRNPDETVIVVSDKQDANSRSGAVSLSRRDVGCGHLCHHAKLPTLNGAGDCRRPIRRIRSGDELGLKPDAFFHLFFCQRIHRGFLVRQAYEIDSQATQFRKLAAGMQDESVSDHAA
jgi:hypothetical protein